MAQAARVRTGLSLRSGVVALRSGVVSSEERLAATGRRGLFPLWGHDTGVLAREFIAAGFQARIVSLDPCTLDASFAGRAYDEQLLAELPASVDPAVRTASSTPSSTPDRSSPSQSPAKPAKSLSARASSSAICCPRDVDHCCSRPRIDRPGSCAVRYLVTRPTVGGVWDGGRSPT